MNEFIKAILSGIVEGFTEFIPVSSTGHLILFGELIEFTGHRADTFSIFIQLGAILAVIFIYPQRFRNLFSLNKPENSFSGFQGLSKLAVACFPAFLLGFLLYGQIKLLFNPVVVAIALILGGVVLYFVESFCKVKQGKSFANLTYLDCLLIGTFQCFALWPGMSRSGSTIVGGMLIGCEKKLATEFSFFLAVPVMMAAVSYELLKTYSYLSTADIPIFAVGFIVSFIVAIIAIKFFLAILERYSFKPFAIYRIILGIIVLLLV